MLADGTFAPEVPLVGGQFFKKADEALVADLKERGLLFRHLPYEHSYPHCWRCHTALLYYAQPSWYIRTTAVKDALIRENEATNWFPETVKHGRFGDWLNNNIDWALSRNRYWGTPLPIWRCEEGHLTCVGSLAELSELTGADQSGLDPHRPYIDDVTFACRECSGTATRVPEVIDAWYDSGSMPFAQYGYPYQNKELFEKRYPAQFISEAIDQTRGWFYTLMAVGTLVFDRNSYENVVCLGHILAEDGRKMSKHLGNILQPIPLMDQHGADAVRWFMAAGGSPWSARRVGHNTIQEVVRKTLLTYWNTVAFQALYARTSGWSPSAADPAPADRPQLDRWVLSELNTLVREVDSAFEAYDTQRAGKLLSGFVDDLSNWYVRRGRRRFWQGDAAALATLHEALETVTRLMAPLTPFITEQVWQDLVVPVSPDAPASVHLATWPEADETLIDADLSRHMALVRRLVELGRATRAESGVKTRQPLSRALIAAQGWEELPADLRAQIAEELNVSTLESLAEVGGSLVDTTAKANFRALGKRFGKGVQDVAKAVAAADAAALAAGLRATGAASVELNGEQISLSRRGDHHRDPARGLGRRQRVRRHRRPRPGHHAGAQAPGHRPRRDPPDPGGPQELRPGRRRPDRPALARHDRGDGRGHRRARSPGRRGGPGHRLLRRRRRLGVRDLLRRGPRPRLPAPQGLTERAEAAVTSPVTAASPFPRPFPWRVPGAPGDETRAPPP